MCAYVLELVGHVSYAIDDLILGQIHSEDHEKLHFLYLKKSSDIVTQNASKEKKVYF